MRGKTINFFLIDGEPTKRIKCTLQNWTGIVYKIPRAMLDNCKDGTSDIVRHLKQTGIYFLLGEDSESGEKMIYIGQAVVRKTEKVYYVVFKNINVTIRKNIGVNGMRL